MKIRTGFVSNSSSSSFIMRASKFDRNELIEILNLQNEVIPIEDDEYKIFDLISDKLKEYKLDSNVDSNYFNCSDYTIFFVGKNIHKIENDEAIEIDDPSPELDQEILNNFQKIGLNPKLKTYIQIIQD